MTTLADEGYTYDARDNIKSVDDKRAAADWRPGFKPRSRQFTHNLAGQLSTATYTPDDVTVDPHADPNSQTLGPLPPLRVKSQSFTSSADGTLLTSSADDGTYP